MLLFIEGYPYNLDHQVRDSLRVRDVLEGVVSFPKLEKEQSFGYVGYCYSKRAKDVVFFLPKVVLTGEKDEDDNSDTIFGASPGDIIDFDSKDIKERFTEDGSKEYKEFLSNLSIWIYRTISVYKQTNNANILESKEHQKESRGRKQKHNTLLDVIIALRDFNKNNQDYFTFIAKNLHSGNNKIQWAKTIAHSQAIVQDGSPIYTNPINKKKVVNFDEELLIIYFSILNYIQQTHGFSFTINLQYQLISPEKLRKTYIERNLGCRRLRQIKYKYFSDKALRIWNLCYAFFDREYKIAMNQTETDYLLAKDFDHIFEVMVDTLVGEQQLPKDLKEQKDGKMIDHMFIGQGLIEQSDVAAKLTYYIGDSKYYKRGRNEGVHLGDNSIYKQYTYARNVIQCNINWFLDGDTGDQPQLRDELTEGYNPIPNFFISARIPSKKERGEKFLKFDDRELRPLDVKKLNRQFENRLFDRDTLLLCHYDVNFLFIVSLYGLDNKSKQATWRDYVRKDFRTRIQATLNSLYRFYTIQPREGMDCYQFIQDNFHRLNGKLYRPHSNSNYLILALMKDENEKDWSELIKKDVLHKVVERETTSNKDLIDHLQSHFHISEPFELDTDFEIPETPNVGTFEPLQKRKKTGVLMVMMENYNSKSVKFLPAGQIAIGIKETADGEKIMANIGNIEYVLFHTRSNSNNKHLFKCHSVQVSSMAYVAEKGIYATPKELQKFLVVEMDTNFEMVSTQLLPQQIPYTPTTRYDSQYVELNELKENHQSESI